MAGLKSIASYVTEPGNAVTEDVVATMADQGALVSVKSFGIVPGDADQTDAIADALDSGEPLYFPPGEYRADVIRLPTCASVRGAGKGKTVFRQNDGVADAGQPVDFMAPIDNATSFLELRSFAVNGNKAGQSTANIGLHIDNTGTPVEHGAQNPYGFRDPRQLVDDVLVFKSKGDGFKQSGRGGGFFDKISTMECDGHGIHIAGYDNIYGLLDTGGAGLCGIYMGGSAANNRISAYKSWYSGQIDRSTYGQGVLLDGAFNNQIGIGEIQNSGQTGMKVKSAGGNSFGPTLIEFPPNPPNAADGLHLADVVDSQFTAVKIVDRGSMPLSLRYGVVLEKLSTGCARVDLNTMVVSTTSGVYSLVGGQSFNTIRLRFNGEYDYMGRWQIGYIATYANDAAAAAAGLPVGDVYFSSSVLAYTYRRT